MKFLNNIKLLSLLTVVFAVSLSACSSVNNDVDSLSEEDIELASEIVAISLADSEDGVVSSMYDAFSNVDESGISYGDPRHEKAGTQNRGRNGRGGEKNFTHSYDPETGTHTLTYERSVENETHSKSSSHIQEIVYTDLDGEFIEQPKADKDSIESISFQATKTGQSEGPTRSSSSTKTDDFEISGLHATSGTLLLDGSHNGLGTAEAQYTDSTGADVTASRSYTISIDFENVALVKDTVQAYGNLEQGVSGTLTYSIEMNKTINGVPEETIVEGTIDLQEDGTALLRFNKIPRVIRLSLVDGERNNSRR